MFKINTKLFAQYYDNHNLINNYLKQYARDICNSNIINFNNELDRHLNIDYRFNQQNDYINSVNNLFIDYESSNNNELILFMSCITILCKSSNLNIHEIEHYIGGNDIKLLPLYTYISIDCTLKQLNNLNINDVKSQDFINNYNNILTNHLDNPHNHNNYKYNYTKNKDNTYKDYLNFNNYLIPHHIINKESFIINLKKLCVEIRKFILDELVL